MNNLINIFPEVKHELIRPLISLEDLQICQMWQQEPHKYRYLLTIFFRYHQLNKSFEIDLNVQYLINKYYFQLWYFIFDELFNYIYLPTPNVLKNAIQSLTEKFFLKEEINNHQYNIKNQINEEMIRYLPWQFFLEKALDKLSPLERIIIVTKDKFAWQEEKILEYLQQQKQKITLSELNAYYSQAHSHLLNSLPMDIITIYLHEI